MNLLAVQFLGLLEHVVRLRVALLVAKERENGVMRDLEFQNSQFEVVGPGVLNLDVYPEMVFLPDKVLDKLPLVTGVTWRKIDDK